MKETRPPKETRLAVENIRQTFVVVNNGEATELTLHGRQAWALEMLTIAGENGCTPAENPAPRWSAYVHQLREMGIEIETIREKHGGRFPGTHGRYILRCRVIRGTLA